MHMHSIAHFYAHVYSSFLCSCLQLISMLILLLILLPFYCSFLDYCHSTAHSMAASSVKKKPIRCHTYLSITFTLSLYSCLKEVLLVLSLPLMLTLHFSGPGTDKLNVALTNKTL